jgi:hypothetical protein
LSPLSRGRTAVPASKRRQCHSDRPYFESTLTDGPCQKFQRPAPFMPVRHQRHPATLKAAKGVNLTDPAAWIDERRGSKGEPGGLERGLPAAGAQAARTLVLGGGMKRSGVLGVFEHRNSNHHTASPLKALPPSGGVSYHSHNICLSIADLPMCWRLARASISLKTLSGVARQTG